LLVITVLTAGRFADLKVRGDLVGPCTDELLKQCRQQIDAGRRLRLDLARTVRVDRASLAKLEGLVRSGMDLIDIWGAPSMLRFDAATFERKEA